MRRCELTDGAWERVRPLLPARARRGGRWRDHRAVLNGIFWVLNPGAAWRDLPERYGPWQIAYGRFRRWTRAGLSARILGRLHLRLDREGKIDWGQFGVDGSYVRADRWAARAARPRPRAVQGRLRHEASPGGRCRGHAAWGALTAGPRHESGSSSV